MSNKTLILALFLCLSAPSLADEAKPVADQPKETPEATAPMTAHLFFLGGANVGQGETATAHNTSGGTGSPVTDSGKNTALFGIEAKKDIPQSPIPVSISAVIERSTYAYSSGSPSDGHYSFLAMPSFHYDTGALRVWAGGGVGLGIMTLGSTSSGSTTLPGSVSGVNYTARFGTDYAIGRMLIGAGIAYTGSSGDMDVSQNSVKVGTISFDAHWVTVGARLGFSF